MRLWEQFFSSLTRSLDLHFPFQRLSLRFKPLSVPLKQLKAFLDPAWKATAAASTATALSTRSMEKKLEKCSGCLSLSRPFSPFPFTLYLSLSLFLSHKVSIGPQNLPVFLSFAVREILLNCWVQGFICKQHRIANADRIQISLRYKAIYQVFGRNLALRWHIIELTSRAGLR